MVRKFINRFTSAASEVASPHRGPRHSTPIAVPGISGTAATNSPLPVPGPGDTTTADVSGTSGNCAPRLACGGEVLGVKLSFLVVLLN